MRVLLEDSASGPHTSRAAALLVQWRLLVYLVLLLMSLALIHAGGHS